MNVCVYAIAKDESRHVERFMRSCADADGVYVLDTGSSDDTAARLRRSGAVVHEETVAPWRFDVARNRALELVPCDADVCVALDLDEVLTDGWRRAVEEVWAHETTRLRYRYAWSETLTFWYDAVHAREGYCWRQPAHEALVVRNARSERRASVDRVLVVHRPDPARARRDDLPLLRLAVAEAPEDPRAAHYLARELYFNGLWQSCVDEVERYLALAGANWPEERSYSCRLAARSRERLGDRASAAEWLLRAATEAPNEREPWCELASLAAADGAHSLAHGAASRALALGERSGLHFNDPAAWGVRPHLLASAAARALGRAADADDHVQAAEGIAHEEAARRGDWRGLEELVSWSVGEGRLDAGAAAVDRLLSTRGVPSAVRARATRAAAGYAAKLTELVSGTRYAPLAFDVPRGWSLFNPSIAADGDGYRAIVRSSNYVLSSGAYDLGGDDRVRTVNYDVRLDRRLELLDVVPLEDRTGARPVSASGIVGYEDCRLVRFDGSWYATATTLEHSDERRCRIALLGLEGSAFASAIVLAEPEHGRHSKNWMPMSERPFTFVYSCAPTVIVGFDPRSGRIAGLSRTRGPRIAEGFRGGSQAVAVPGGHLFLVHEVVALNGPARVYLHRFVFMDESLTITRLSRPFVFLHRGVEFCAGLAILGDTVTVGFGFRDAEAYVAAAPLDGVLTALDPIEELRS